MRGNKGKDTKPELKVRSALHRRGYRFRKDYAVQTDGGRVQVDIAFPRRRVAIFIDGCFWHRCPEHGRTPKTNSAYWSEKLRRNAERDDRVDALLRDQGWTVLRVWEHVATAEAVNAVAAALLQT